MSGADKDYFDQVEERIGAVVAGRSTYDAAEAWGGTNPWQTPFFIATHRTDEEPEGAGLNFVDGPDAAIARAREAAGDKDVMVMGGAGKALFDGFDKDVELTPVSVHQSAFATHVWYAVKQ